MDCSSYWCLLHRYIASHFTREKQSLLKYFTTGKHALLFRSGDWLGIWFFFCLVKIMGCFHNMLTDYLHCGILQYLQSALQYLVSLRCKYSLIHLRIYSATAINSHIINKHHWCSFTSIYTCSCITPCLTGDVVCLRSCTIDWKIQWTANQMQTQHLESTPGLLSGQLDMK